jgi:hypothetical protein
MTLAGEIAAMLVQIERNYDREGSGPGSRFEGRTREAVQAEAVLRRFAERLKDEVADEMTAITAETVLEAVAMSTARIAELEQLAGDMLGRFRTHDGFAVSFCPSLAQFDRWQATLKGTP